MSDAEKLRAFERLMSGEPGLGSGPPGELLHAKETFERRCAKIVPPVRFVPRIKSRDELVRRYRGGAH